MANTVKFSSPDEYSIEQADIERQRKYAEMLQEQAMQPLQGGGMVGNVYVPMSWTQGMAGALRGPMAQYKSQQLDKRTQALADALRNDFSSTARKYNDALKGTPARTTAPDPFEYDQMGEGTPTPKAVTTPAIPGSSERAMQVLAQSHHPMMQQLYMQRLQQDMQRQQWADIFGQGEGAQAGGGTPVQAGVGTGTPSQVGGAPGNVLAGTGISMKDAWASLLADPTGKQLTEKILAARMEANKPQNVRPGGTIAQRDANGNWVQGYYSPVLGEGIANTPKGGATVVPGYAEAQAAVGRTPMEKVQNADQTISYVPKAQLAQAATPAASSMRESPQQLSSVGSKQLAILQAEADDQMQKTGKVDPALQADIQKATLRANGQYPQGKPSMSGGGLGDAPKFGQTQEEQIRQAGQTAANTEAGKEFISEMRQNYAKLRDVPATLENIERAKTLAAGQAKQFMGPFSQSKLAVTKFIRSNVPGMGNLNTEGVTGAEELQSTLFNQTMDNLKKMDASPSEYQQKVMQQAFGTLTTDPQSIPKVLDVFSDILRNRVDIHNETVTSAEGRGTVFPYDVKVKLKPKSAGDIHAQAEAILRGNNGNR